MSKIYFGKLKEKKCKYTPLVCNNKILPNIYRVFHGYSFSMYPKVSEKPPHIETHWDNNILNQRHSQLDHVFQVTTILIVSFDLWIEAYIEINLGSNNFNFKTVNLCRTQPCMNFIFINLSIQSASFLLY